MKKSGFTMIELIFVIVILGVLAAVAIPKLNATRDDAEVAKAATNIATLVGDFTSFYTAQGHFANTFSVMTNVPLANETERKMGITQEDADSSIEKERKNAVKIGEGNGWSGTPTIEEIKEELQNANNILNDTKIVDKQNAESVKTTLQTILDKIDEINASVGQAMLANLQIKNENCLEFKMGIDANAKDVNVIFVNVVGESKPCKKAVEMSKEILGLDAALKKGSIKVSESNVKF